MPASPNVENLSLLKGIVKYRPASSGGAYRDLGECLTFTTTMAVQVLEYQSRRHSTRIPVKVVNIGKTLTVAMTMSEFSLENLEMALMGTAVGSPAVIPIGQDAEVRGSLRVIGENTLGQAMQIDLYDVSLRPNGALAWLADADWSEMVMEGTANADPSTGKFGDAQLITAGHEVAMGSPPA